MFFPKMMTDVLDFEYASPLYLRLMGNVYEFITVLSGNINSAAAISGNSDCSLRHRGQVEIRTRNE